MIIDHVGTLTFHDHYIAPDMAVCAGSWSQKIWIEYYLRDLLVTLPVRSDCPRLETEHRMMLILDLTQQT